MRRAALVALMAGLIAAPPPAEPDFVGRMPPPTAGPVLFAFNGRNLDGFSTFLKDQKGKDPRGVFAVADGCLRISGAEFGGVATRAPYANYHLVAEWRWGGPTHYPRRFRARNSGILVHCTGPEGGGLGAWMEGLETQLIEGGSGDLILVPGAGRPPRRLRAEVRIGPDGQPYFQPGGAVVARSKGRVNWWGRDPTWDDVLWMRGPDDLERPVGEWNRTEVVCDRDRVTVYLNGRVANAASGLDVAAGRILLQSEGAEVWFRRFEVRALPPAPG